MMVINMYVSTVPNIVTMRASRDKSKDVSGELHAIGNGDPAGVGFQFKRMLLFDTTWVFVAFYLIAAFEDAKLRDNPDTAYFTTFRVLFEVVSAFGTVGMSLGYPGVPTSFCGVWRPGSKLVLILVMLAGRHRGLPDRIDQAIRPACLPLDEGPRQFWKLRSSSKSSVPTAAPSVFRPTPTLATHFALND
jgi:hypothetical protein